MGEKKDLTRIEDLSEFLHEEDAGTNDKPDEGGSPPEESNEQINSEVEEGPDISFTATSIKSESADISPLDEENANDKEEMDAIEQEDSPEFSSEPEELNMEEEESDLSDASSMEEAAPLDSSLNEENPLDQPAEFGNEEPDAISETKQDESNETESESKVLSLKPVNEEQNNDFSNSLENQEQAEGEDPFINQESSLEQEVPSQENIEAQSHTQEDSTKSPPPIPKPSSPPREKLEEVKKFAESITFNKVETGSNPPFSIILKNIKTPEDAEDIRIILREHGLLDEKNKREIEQGLSHGNVLISQVSEYAAIYLAHRFRRFDVDISMGLSDDLHPSQNYDHDARGLISKENIKQNESETLDLTLNDTSKVILATTSVIEGHKILRHIDVITEHSIIKEEDLEAFEEKRTHELYQNLSEKLKLAAKKRKGNAVVGVNYQFTPLSEGAEHPARYKVTCSGNVVLVENEQN
ncbi:MAG: hypothetical protein OXB84_09330 [Halobacteriovoraceae bacterium]|nr:hypothetical protein [Halobacteriovoraceae bacterium]